MNTSVSTLHKFQTLAILVLIFADGCDVGQFALSSFNVLNMGSVIAILLHALAGFIVMGFGIQFFYSPRSLAPRIGISFISTFAVVGNIVMIILGATNPDPNSVGVHSPGDWTVAIVIITGALLWFATLLVERVQSARVRHAAIA